MSAHPSSLRLVPDTRADGEAELVDRAARGDDGAYAELVSRHERLAYRLAVAVAGNAADGEEAVQNAYLKAHAALPRFRRGERFRPWLLRIVINEAHNVRRAERRHERLLERAAAAAPRPEGPSSHDVLVEREEAAAVLRALARLSDVDRSALALRHFAELPDAEAAALLGVTPGAYRVRVLRALRRLRVLLALALVAAALGLLASPAGSALGRLLGVVDNVEVRTVPALEPPPPAVAPPLLGIPAELGDALTIGELGMPDAVYRRNDIAGDVATLLYGDVVLAQWPARDVRADLAVVEAAGRAEEVRVGDASGVWIAGDARGLYTFVGADGADHHEAFAVTDGILLWQLGGTAFRLEGAGSKETAVRLAASVSRP
jgi:RNA polymerase sigma factor (sigma-70 family)